MNNRKQGIIYGTQHYTVLTLNIIRHCNYSTNCDDKNYNGFGTSLDAEGTVRYTQQPEAVTYQFSETLPPYTGTGEQSIAIARPLLTLSQLQGGHGIT